MKLIYCKACRMIFNLAKTVRECECGETGGKYLADGLNAIYWGDAFPLIILHDPFQIAKENQPESGAGFPFDAFLIPENVPTMKKVEKPTPKKRRKK